jgi:CAAX prenyl protease-like protein
VQLSPRFSPTVAFVAPLAVFLLFTSLTSVFTVENSQLPWWRSAPEHWLYPLQTFVCGGLLLYFRRDYDFRPWRGLGLASLLGGVGIALWIAPAWLFAQGNDTHHEMPALPWLGFAARMKGYDPSIFDPATAIYWEDVILRFVRLVVVVPLVEEIFWRGFLMRYVIAGDKPFIEVPFGKHDWRAYAVTTVLFMLVHQKEDWLGALVFGSLMNFLCVRTKSLGACVWMHAVANLLLGFYVMKTRQWGFW